MAGSKALRYLQPGLESTPGSPVAASTIWRGEGNLQGEYTTLFPVEDVGIIGGADRGYIPKISAQVDMTKTPLTFEQMPYIGAAGLKNIVTGVADGTGSGKVYAYPLSTTAVNTIKTYTLEFGDDQQEEEGEYGFVEKFKLTGKAAEAWMMEATWRARQATPSTKTGSLSIPTVEEALFQNTTLAIDTAGGTLGATVKSGTLIGAEIDVTTGWVARWTADNQLYFNQPVMGVPNVTAKLTFLHEGTAVAEKAAWKAGTSRLIRLRCIGSALTTASAYTNKTLLIDLAGRWLTFDKIGEDTGNDIVTGTLQVRYNSTATLSFSATVVNQLSSLP